MSKGIPEHRAMTLVHAMIEFPTYTQSQLSEYTGIPVRTIQAWKTRDDFNQMLDKEMHLVFKDGAKIALKTMRNLAEDGDYRAAEFILKNNGFSQPDKLDINTNDIKITISND